METRLLRTLRQPRNTLLPLLASQSFAAAMMLAGRLSFLDWQMLTLIEAWLVHLSLLRFDERRKPRERAQNFALVSLVVLPMLFLFIALLSMLMLDPDDHRLPWALVAEAAARATHENFRIDLAYLAIGLGISLLQAGRADRRARWWRERVVAQYEINTVATLAALFLLGPLIVLRQQIEWVRALPASTVDLALLAMLAALRLALAVRVQRLERGG
jgi:hypothetical protein